MAQWFAGALGLLAFLLLARLFWEWRRYAAGGHLITRRQMVLRVASAVDLVLLLVLIALGARIEFSTAQGAFAYWGLCLLMALGAMAMAVADLSLLRGTYGRRRAERFRRLSMYIRTLEQSRGGQVPRT